MAAVRVSTESQRSGNGAATAVPGEGADPVDEPASPALGIRLDVWRRWNTLWDVEPGELVRRSRESFERCWEEWRVAA